MVEMTLKVWMSQHPDGRAARWALLAFCAVALGAAAYLVSQTVGR